MVILQVSIVLSANIHCILGHGAYLLRARILHLSILTTTWLASQCPLLSALGRKKEAWTTGRPPRRAGGDNSNQFAYQSRQLSVSVTFFSPLMTARGDDFLLSNNFVFSLRKCQSDWVKESPSNNLQFFFAFWTNNSPKLCAINMAWSTNGVEIPLEMVTSSKQGGPVGSKLTLSRGRRRLNPQEMGLNFHPKRWLH